MTACGSELDLISVDQAIELINIHTRPLESEVLPLAESLNRYLAESAESQIDLPAFSQSAVDGYALCAHASIAAHTCFELIGEVRAGQVPTQTLALGQAMRIFTGAEIPKGTTSVARQEIVECIDANHIALSTDLKLHADIRDAAEELKCGQCIAETGQQLNVGSIAALSMAGVAEVEVYRYPKIAVVISGDEVAAVGATAKTVTAGQIFDANAPMIRAWFLQQGHEVEIYHVSDQMEAVSDLIQQLSLAHDLILTTGGVSVGDYDFIRPATLAQGFEQVFWKVKQKPGKPMLFALKKRPDRTRCYLLGLAGNPAAVYVGMQIYTTTILAVLQGTMQTPPWFSAQLKHDLDLDARERFLRMTAKFDQATLTVNRLAKQQSHMLSNLTTANCLVRIAAGQRYAAGDVVQGLWI